VDAERGTVEQYLLRDGKYELELKTSSGEIRSSVIAGFVAPVRAFFYTTENLAAMRRMMS